MMGLGKTGKIAAQEGLTARRGADSGFKLATGPPHKDSDYRLPAVVAKTGQPRIHFRGKEVSLKNYVIVSYIHNLDVFVKQKLVN